MNKRRVNKRYKLDKQYKQEEKEERRNIAAPLFAKASKVTGYGSSLQRPGPELARKRRITF